MTAPILTEAEMPALPAAYGYIHDAHGNQPLSFERGAIPFEKTIACSTEQVYSYAQLRARDRAIETELAKQFTEDYIAALTSATKETT